MAIAPEIMMLRGGAQHTQFAAVPQSEPATATSEALGDRSYRVPPWIPTR
jgi:hypothetical protein